MECQFCNSDQVVVTNSRSTKSKTAVWRRRKCLKCLETFTTYEKADLSYLRVQKRSGKIQKYNRAKLFVSIYTPAMETKNADRGDMAKFAEAMTQIIEEQMMLEKRGQVTTRELIEIVLAELHQHSVAVFLKFLAYREGADEKKMLKMLSKYLKS